MEICAGEQSQQQASILLVRGGSTYLLGYAWQSTVHNNYDINCRPSLVYLNNGDQISTSLQSSSVFSDSNLETSFSAFSIADAMTDQANNWALVASGSSLPFTAENRSIPLQVSYGSGVYVSNAYQCPVTGFYFFSISVGVNSGKVARVLLNGLSIPIELTRLSTTYNGMTTLSRNVLLQCQAGASVTLTLITGEVSTLPNYNLVSFGAFPYLPRRVPNPVAWAAYKSYNSDTSDGAAKNPFYFDTVARQL